MLKILKAIVASLVCGTVTCQGLGNLPHFNEVSTFYPQQVLNGTSMFPLVPCYQILKGGQDTYHIGSSPKPTYNLCSTPRQYVEQGRKIELWTTAGSLLACNHLTTTNGYMCIFLIDFIIPGCDPIFPPSYTFPDSFPGADQVQLIYPDLFMPSRAGFMPMFGVRWWHYWIDMPIPVNPIFLGSWITAQSVRYDTTFNQFFFSNRVDVLIGPPAPID